MTELGHTVFVPHGHAAYIYPVDPETATVQVADIIDHDEQTDPSI